MKWLHLGVLESILWAYFSHLCITVMKRSKEKNLEKEKFILAHNFRGLVYHQPPHSSGPEVRQNIMVGGCDKGRQLRTSQPCR